jgi:uncharacterized delta-60 repeat protein
MRKLIVSAVMSLCLMAACSPAFARAGSLDPTFGKHGIVQTNFGSGNAFTFSGAALAPNGDIVVSGDLISSGELGAVVRYLPSGAIDSSLGNNGVLTLPRPSQFLPGMSFTAGITIQTDGKMLVLFGAFNDSRRNTNGQPDTTFGNGGQASLNFPVPSGYVAVGINLVQVQTDGKILLGGVVTPPNRSKLPLLTFLGRFLANGVLDRSFGKDGNTEVAAIGYPSSLSFSGSDILAGSYLGQIAEFSSTGDLLQLFA